MAHWSSGQDASLSRWKLGFDSRMGHQKNEAPHTRCFIFLVTHPPKNTARKISFSRARVRIPHPKIDKLACQAQGVGIFAVGEIPGFTYTSYEVLFSFFGDPSAHLPAQNAARFEFGFAFCE